MRRSLHIGNALKAGCQSLGLRVEWRPDTAFRGAVENEVAAFYGLSGSLGRILKTYKAHPKAKAVYVDLGYWSRRLESRFDGYHKLAINSRHPTDYFQTGRLRAGRLAPHGIRIEPWRTGGSHILVAGMSGKAALAEGFLPNQWEAETIMRLRKITDRPIVYRPKPNWLEARPVGGTTMDAHTPLAAALRDAWAVVTHHSNVAVDAILAGVPAFVEAGVAVPMGAGTLDNLETPLRPEGREEWAERIAWTQFSVAEIASGLAWRHLVESGLIPR